MAAEGLRRSTRARKPVVTYAAEFLIPAAEDDAPLKAAAPRRKRAKIEVEDDDATLKKPKKSSGKDKASRTEDNASVMGWTKKGLSIFVADPKSITTDNSWHADAAEKRNASNARNIQKLHEGEEEQRLRPYVTSPPISFHSALKKASSQRMFVLERVRDTEPDCHAHHHDCPRETLQVAGSTGNVYAVKITHMPSCSCPAGIFQRKGEETVCKHVLYVLHNVLKAPEHLKQQNAFLTSELNEIFANAPTLPSVVAAQEEFDGKRKALEDDCPICCMEFEDAEEVVWCRAACGNNVHKACFDQWAKTKGGRVTCPFCRSPWEYDAPKAQKVSVAAVDMSVERGKGGYRNVRDQLDYD